MCPVDDRAGGGRSGPRAPGVRKPIRRVARGPGSPAAALLALAAAVTPAGAQEEASPARRPPDAQVVRAVDCGLEQRFSPARPRCLAEGIVGTGPVWIEGADTARLTVLPAVLSGYVRSDFPMDRDNGAVWSGRGLSTAFEAGVAGRYGPVRFAFYPTLHWSQNRDFATTDTVVGSFSSFALPWESVTIDTPQRFGTGTRAQLSPGQSFLELRGPWDAAVGISTENVWWGASWRYPLVLGATAEGFPHLYARSPTIDVGPTRFVFRALVGRLEESKYFDADEANDVNILSVLRFEVTPVRSLGLTFAFSSTRRQNREGIGLGDLFAVRAGGAQGGRGLAAVDGLGVAEVRFLVPGADVELSGTWGRGDNIENAEDFLTEPDHNQFWQVGVRRWWVDEHDARWSLRAEHASTASSSTLLGLRGRGAGSVYRHSKARQGHTHEGQLLAASFGPGSIATYGALSRTAGELRLEVVGERIIWDRDVALNLFREEKGRGARDREYLMGFGAAGPGWLLGLDRLPGLSFQAFGGVSRRKNRQFIRFTGSNFADMGAGETNLWLDFKVVWRPG